MLWGRLERKGVIAAEECSAVTEIRGIRTMLYGAGDSNQRPALTLGTH